MAAWEKDIVRTEEIQRELIENVESVGSFADSELYRHLTFKKSESGFYQRMWENLIQLMSDDSFDNMRGNTFCEEVINSGTEGEYIQRILMILRTASAGRIFSFCERNWRTEWTLSLTAPLTILRGLGTQQAIFHIQHVEVNSAYRCHGFSVPCLSIC